MRIYIVFLIIVFISCRRNYDNENLGKVMENKNVPAIIDSFSTVPFTIKHKPKFVVPDSLGGANLTGFIVLSVEFDSLENMVNFEIEKLQAKRNHETIITYIKPNKKSNVIRNYEKLCGVYLKTIEFKKNPLSENKNGNKIRMLIRFNE